MKRSIDLLENRTITTTNLFDVIVEESPQVDTSLDVMSIVSLLQTSHGGGRVAISGSIELTPRCNLKCQHCYINEPANDREVRSREMTTEQYKRVIDGIVEEGTLYLTLTGGEIFLRPDFRDIYLYALEKGLFISLFTNATLITQKIADFLEQYPPRTIEITIYGYSEKVYEEVTGIKGSHAKFMRGLRLLQERNIEFLLKTVIMTINQHEYEDMRAFAESMGKKLAHDTAIFARLDGGKQPCGLRVEAERVLEIDLSEPAAACELSEAFEGQAALPESDNLYRCGAAKNTYHITAFGDIAACTISKSIDFNLKEHSFHDAWHGPLLDESNRKKSDVFTKCKTCQVKEYCTICPAKAILESGNPEFQIDYFCSVAELRASMIGKNRKTIPLMQKPVAPVATLV